MVHTLPPASPPVVAYNSNERVDLCGSVDRHTGTVARRGLQVGISGREGILYALGTELCVCTWKRMGFEGYDGRIRSVVCI
jgi:hypothetical protein